MPRSKIEGGSAFSFFPFCFVFQFLFSNCFGYHINSTTSWEQRPHHYQLLFGPDQHTHIVICCADLEAILLKSRRHPTKTKPHTAAPLPPPAARSLTSPHPQLTRPPPPLHHVATTRNRIIMMMTWMIDDDVGDDGVCFPLTRLRPLSNHSHTPLHQAKSNQSNPVQDTIRYDTPARHTRCGERMALSSPMSLCYQLN